MTSRKKSAHKKKEKRPAEQRKLHIFKNQYDRIVKCAKASALTTPVQLLVIASYLNRLNFKERINQYVRWDPTQWKYSPGVLAQLMVLAAFIPSTKKIALCRLSHAYAGMDLRVLVGEYVDPAELSDHLFACMLDRLWEAGCEKFLCSIALTVRTVFNLPPNHIFHSDTTSHMLCGDYANSESVDDPSRVHPTHGLSKNKRPDRKQIMTGMVTDGDGLILNCCVLDGNTADCEYNHTMLQTLQEVYGDEFYKHTYIADSKLLNKKNLELIYGKEKPAKIISCIPENFAGKRASKIRHLAYEEQNWQYIGICCKHPAGNGKEPEYWVQTFQQEVFDIPVWVHIYKSGDAEHKLQKAIKKAREAYESDLKSLTKKKFACEPDASTELQAFINAHRKSFFSVNLSCVSSVNEKNPVGRPSKTVKPTEKKVTWAVSAGPIIQNEEKIEQQRRKDETFCLLTTIEPDTMGSREVLLYYKGQINVEGMFSVLKHPLLAATLFLEKPERIEALMTLLYFCVLMHGILQVISRIRIATCAEPPRLGPDDRPLIRPKSETMLNILALYDFDSYGDVMSFRSKITERSSQLELLMYLVDFDPGAI
jgi:transposase